MNETMSPADQRLLDATLRQLLRARGVAPTATSPQPRPHRWLAAALLLLGIAVPTSLALQRRERHEPTMPNPAQQPAPLPAEVAAEEGTLADLPADTVNLRLTIGDPARLADLERFAGLRRLVLTPAMLGRNGPRIAAQWRDWWGKPRPDLLQPLMRLERLEQLEFAFPVVVNSEVLQPLVGHPALRSLSLVAPRAPIDNAAVAALAAMRRLSALHLVSFPLDAAAMQRLAQLPLEYLELSHCAGFDDDCWQALLSMQTLRALRFEGWGRTPLGAAADAAPFWRPEAEQLRRLATLPNLTTLTLQDCDLRDDEVAALPDKLTELHLHAHELTAAGFLPLRHLQRLRVLDLDAGRQRRTIGDLFEADDAGEVADAIASALEGLELERLDYWGAMTPSLLARLAGLTTLTELRLTSRQLQSFAGLETLPRLHSLTVYEASAPGALTIETLRPLAAAPSLRRLDVSVAHLDELAAKQLFGAHVTVTTTSWQEPKPR